MAIGSLECFFIFLSEVNLIFFSLKPDNKASPLTVINPHFIRQALHHNFSSISRHLRLWNNDSQIQPPGRTSGIVCNNTYYQYGPAVCAEKMVSGRKCAEPSNILRPPRCLVWHKLRRIDKRASAAGKGGLPRRPKRIHNPYSDS